MKRLALFVALAAPLCAQSPVETTFANPAPNTFVTATPTPITCLFDIAVTDPSGITITQIDLQVSANHGTNGQFAVYVTGAGDTHVGNEQNAAAWTQVSTATAVHNGGRVTFLLQTPFTLGPASYGMAFHCIEANPLYHAGATSVTLPPQYTSNELTIDLSAGRNRASDPVDPFIAGGNGFSPRQLAMAVYYVVGGTSVDFTADVTDGPSPMTVNFTSISSTTAPGGILQYIWDIDNDGNPDYVTQNCTHTFGCGTFSVSHSIVDANGVTTETKLDFINTDIVTPEFDNVLLGPNTLQFTDTSTPTPTSWEWDLDGDGLTDSTSPNPTFAYGSACDEVTVSLTVSRNCQPSVTLTRTIAVASRLETTFAGGLITVAAPTNAANYFDLDVSNPLGVTVCGMHVNNGTPAGLPLTVNVYQAEGSYVGKTGDASLWRLVASETVPSSDGRTFVPFSSPVYFAFGTHGVCMEHLGESPTYTNTGGTFTVSNADVTLTAGLAQGDPVFDPAATTFSPRTANVALHYATSATTGAPGYGYIGFGCAGTLGIPGNVSSTQPVIGGGATIEIDNLPFDIGLMALGLNRLSPPLDLAIVGMPACPLHHSADVLLTIVGAANAATFSFPLPNSGSLVGSLVFTQAASLDLGLNALGFAISDAAALLVGQ